MTTSLATIMFSAPIPGLANLAASYVALAVAVISAMVSLFLNKKSRANSLEIEALKARLTERASERDARRDYEYEARKRLYSDIEPLLFQLTEAVEIALRRVSSLAVNAREGALSEDSTWLTVMTEYYATFTMYQFILPAAILRLIQEKLTFVDFGVDKKLHLQFRIGKQIYGLWRADHDIRRSGRELEYKPYAENARHLRLENPQGYWKQGIATGHLDIVTSAFIVRSGETVPRVLTYEEFTRLMNGESRPAAFEPLIDLFRGFHPFNRPVLWRILAGQAMLYRALLDLRDGADSESFRIRSFSEVEIVRHFDWREIPGIPVAELVEPFDAAAEYLCGQLGASIIEIRNDRYA